MILPDLKTPLLWVLGLGLAAALATVGIERTRAASARTDASDARRELAELRGAMAEAASRAEREQRSLEQTWRNRVEGVIHDGQQQIVAARADAAAAARAAHGVQQQLATYRAAVSAASATPAAAAGGAPAIDPLDLLSDLFGRADARAGDLAEYADRARIAGVSCERSYDALTVK